MNAREADPILARLAQLNPVDDATLVTDTELDGAWSGLRFSILTEAQELGGPESAVPEAPARRGRPVAPLPITRQGRLTWSEHLRGSGDAGYRPRRPLVAFGIVLVGAAALTIGLLLASGGGLSLVARAYAATDPRGMIVHYVEASQYRLPGGKLGPVEVDQVWIDGSERRVLSTFTGATEQTQDIVSRPGTLENLTNGRLTVLPDSHTARPCSAAEALVTCTTFNGGTPIAALRSLLHAHQIRPAGSTTFDGHTVDVLSGSARSVGALSVRAFIDPHTFVPVKITMTRVLPHSNGQTPTVQSLTITQYQQLKPTVANRKRLSLPAHPNAQILRYRACPTTRLPNKLCRAS